MMVMDRHNIERKGWRTKKRDGEDERGAVSTLAMSFLIPISTPIPKNRLSCLIVQLHVTEIAADAHVFISSDMVLLVIIIISQKTIMQADDVQPSSPRDA